MYAITMKSPYTIEIWRGINKMWYFHVAHRNGRIICFSEGYTRKRRAVLAAQKLSLNLSNAQFIIK